MKNKNGFISMTLVYSFLIIFLFLLLAILKIYSENNKFLMTIDEMVNDDLENIRLTRSNLITIILQDNVPFDSSKIDISAIAGGDLGNGNGLYYIEDAGVTDENGDGLTQRIYYFRGNVLNNFVMVRENKTCWRIVRTNEDGSIRMVYYGISEDGKTCPTPSPADVNTGYVGDCANDDSTCTPALGQSTCYNDVGDDKKYTGYMFSRHGFYDESTINVCLNHTCQSCMKAKLESWYNRYFVQNHLEPLVADAIFCVNREGGDSASGSDWRFRRYTSRTFKCAIEYDRLALSIFNQGAMRINTSLFYPVGLLTSADVYFAGGGYRNENPNYYLSYIDNGWTMTPYGMEAGQARVLYLKKVGNATMLEHESVVSDALNAYPVISLKPTVKVLGGSGLFANPYIVGKEEETGE